jgi:hypothetical protein
MEFQKALEEMVKDIIRKNQANITREDAKIIIQELLPDLDALISKKIKEHFVALAYAIQSKFNSEEEKMDAKDS